MSTVKSIIGIQRMGNKQNYVYITDEKYVMPTTVSIVSLIDNSKDTSNIIIHVVAICISEKSKKKLMEINFNNINIVEFDHNKYTELEKDLYAKRGRFHVSAAALYKMNLADLFPNIKLMLYLDGDTIINRDLSHMFDWNMAEYHLAAVNEMADVILKDGSSEYANRIGINGRYFNSGVMLLNLEKIRIDNKVRELIKYRSNGKNYYMDQDAFNYIFAFSRLNISYKYNFRTFLMNNLSTTEFIDKYFSGNYNSMEECLDDQCIYHMADKDKAWDFYFPWISEIFLKYYRMSPYKEYPLNMENSIALALKHKQVRERMKKWLFPYNYIKKDSKIIIWGAGKVGKDVVYQIEKTDYCSLEMWVDSNLCTDVKGVVAPEFIKTVDFDYLLICIINSSSVDRVKKCANDLGVADSKIVSYIECFDLDNRM